MGRKSIQRTFYLNRNKVQGPFFRFSQPLGAYASKIYFYFQVIDLYRLIHGELQDTIETCEKLKLKVTQNREEMERDIENDVKQIEAFK